MRRGMLPGIALSFLLVALAAVALRPGEAPPTARLAGPEPPPPTPAVPTPRPAPAAVPAATRPEPAAPRRPDAAFTRVEPGEDLAAVARRVYGAGGDVEALWRANRDQLAAVDAPLVAGMLLRTPRPETSRGDLSRARGPG